MSTVRSIASRFRDLVGVIGGFFEEPRVTRHIVVMDSGSGFTVPDPSFPISDRHFHDLHAPGVVAQPQPVIMFRTSHTGSGTFSVRLNTTRLTVHNFSDPGPYTWHEIIPQGSLKPENNELTVAVSGGGSVRFSDIVIFYTSNTLTARIPYPIPEVVLD